MDTRVGLSSGFSDARFADPILWRAGRVIRLIFAKPLGWPLVVLTGRGVWIPVALRSALALPPAAARLSIAFTAVAWMLRRHTCSRCLPSLAEGRPDIFSYVVTAPSFEQFGDETMVPERLGDGAEWLWTDSAVMREDFKFIAARDGDESDPGRRTNANR